MAHKCEEPPKPALPSFPHDCVGCLRREQLGKTGKGGQQKREGGADRSNTRRERPVNVRSQDPSVHLARPRKPAWPQLTAECHSQTGRSKRRREYKWRATNLEFVDVHRRFKLGRDDKGHGPGKPRRVRANEVHSMQMPREVRQVRPERKGVILPCRAVVTLLRSPVCKRRITECSSI